MKGMLQDDCYALNPQYASPSSAAVDAKNTILIPYLSKGCISSMQEIGQGYFGKVYKGMLAHIINVIVFVVYDYVL